MTNVEKRDNLKRRMGNDSAFTMLPYNFINHGATVMCIPEDPLETRVAKWDSPDTFEDFPNIPDREV